MAADRNSVKEGLRIRLATGIFSGKRKYSKEMVKIRINPVYTGKSKEEVFPLFSGCLFG